MVQRLAKGVLPPNTQIQKDAIVAMSKGATVFINHIADKYVDFFKFLKSCVGNLKFLYIHDILHTLYLSSIYVILPSPLALFLLPPFSTNTHISSTTRDYHHQPFLPNYLSTNTPPPLFLPPEPTNSPSPRTKKPSRPSPSSKPSPNANSKTSSRASKRNLTNSTKSPRGSGMNIGGRSRRKRAVLVSVRTAATIKISAL